MAGKETSAPFAILNPRSSNFLSVLSVFSVVNPPSSLFSAVNRL